MLFSLWIIEVCFLWFIVVVLVVFEVKFFYKIWYLFVVLGFCGFVFGFKGDFGVFGLLLDFRGIFGDFGIFGKKGGDGFFGLFGEFGFFGIMGVIG